MNTLDSITSFFLFLSFGFLIAQGDADQFFLRPYSKEMLLQKTTAKDSLILWQEQIELQLDKNAVAPKDPIFFKAYVLTGPNQIRQSVSEVLKVELLDESGKLMKGQYHKIVDGVSMGSIEVPKKTESGDYFLRAYTRWMMNYGPNKFALKEIEIGELDKTVSLNEKSDTPIQFFPEGGQIVAGLKNRMAIKGNTDLLSSVEITDNDGNIVSSVTKYTDELAMATFKPENGRNYFLSTVEGQKYALPRSSDKGVTLLSNNIDARNAQVRIEVSPELMSKKLYLKGLSKGIIYFERELNFQSKPVIELEIQKEGIPKGVLSLRVIDEFDQEWAKRPIYIENDELSITIEPYEGTVFKVKVTDNEDKPVETVLSLGANTYNNTANKMGVADYQVAANNFRGQRFVNDLFLLSGKSLDGHSELPDIYAPSEIYYDFQQGLEFYGQAYDLNDNLLVNTKIQVLVSSEDDVMAQEVTTNADGMFKITGMHFEGEAGMVFRTKADGTKEKMVKVISYVYEVPPLKDSNQHKAYLKLQGAENLPKTTTSVNSVDDASDRLITLNGVTLTEGKRTKTYSRPSVYGIEPNRVVHQDVERPKTIPQLLLGIPGVQVFGLGGLEQRVSLPKATGTGPLLWVLDGFPLVQPTSLVEIISLISYIDVERIELLFGPQAAIYGTRAAGGAFLIYTRSGNFDDYYNRKEAQLTYQGFHKSIDFETYINGLSSKEKENNGVVYWNPSLKTDENGEVLIKLDSSRLTDKLKIEATAITEEGRVGKTTKYFNTQ